MAEVNETPQNPEPSAAPEAASVPKRATNVVTPPPAIKLEIYEGPLDLLLDLIRKQEINIYDIPIAQITREYLNYLRMLEEMNIDVAGEFIFMAATLIHIKSRMLLPRDPAAPPEELEDPRTELVHRLLEHEQFKNAAEMLQSKRLVEDAMWSEPGIGEFVEAEDEPGLAVSVFDLVSVFRDIIERATWRKCSNTRSACSRRAPIRCGSTTFSRTSSAGRRSSRCFWRCSKWFASTPFCCGRRTCSRPS